MEGEIGKKMRGANGEARRKVVCLMYVKHRKSLTVKGRYVSAGMRARLKCFAASLCVSSVIRMVIKSNEINSLTPTNTGDRLFKAYGADIFLNVK